MTAPTVQVTVSLATMGGPAVAGVVITATLDVNEVYDGIIISSPVTATTDDSGVAVMALFPNQPAPAGLGTQGSTYRLTASVPNGQPLDRQARFPNSDCHLADCLVDTDPVLDAYNQQGAALAQAWATKTSGEVVVGQGYGSKKYADDAAANANQTAVDRAATGADRTQTSADRAQTSADRAQTGADRTQTGLDAASALASKNDAAVSATNAGLARDSAILAGKMFSTTADALSKGVGALSGLVAGSGGTDGQYDLAFSGGGGSGAAGRFVVAGGTVQAGSVTITCTGRGYTSAPAVSLAACPGLTGASLTAVLSDNAPNTTYFFVPSTIPGLFGVLYRNDAGTATPLKAFVSSEQFGDMNNDPNWKWGLCDSSGLHLAIGLDANDNFIIVTLQADTATLGTLTVTGAATAASLQAPKIIIPTDDVGLHPDQAAAELDQTGQHGSRIWNKDGSQVIPSLEVDNLTVTTGFSSPAVTATKVEATRLGGRSTKALLNAALPRGLNYVAQILHLLVYGQSNSNGTYGIPVLTTNHLFNTKMFNGGMRPNDATGGTGNGVMTSLVDSVESLFNTNWGETVASGAAYAIRRLLKDEYGIDYSTQDFQLLMSVHGEGGKSIMDLTSDTYGYFARLPAAASAGKAAAAALNKSYDVGGVLMVHGEQDANLGTANADYIKYLQAFIAKAKAQVQAVTGTNRDFWLVYAQTASHLTSSTGSGGSGAGIDGRIAMAQCDAMFDNPLMRCACPTYQFGYQSFDQIHYLNTTHLRVGYYLGLMLFRNLIEGKEFYPLFCWEAMRSGNSMLLRYYPPKGNLTFDTTGVVSPRTNYGFVLRDLATNTVIPQPAPPVMLNGIGSVIQVTGNATLPSTVVCDYAIDADVAGKTGPTQGPRGNLRDQQGDTISWDPNSTPGGASMTATGFRMDNWALMQRIRPLN